jgi:hypothetical protein
MDMHSEQHRVMATQIEERAPLGNSCTVSVANLTGDMLGVCAMGSCEPWLALLRRIEATSDIDPATIRLVCNGGIARLDHSHGAANAAVRGQAFVIAIQGPPSCTLCAQAFNSGAGKGCICGAVSYCSTGCQLGDYKEHQLACHGVRMWKLQQSFSALRKEC